MSEPYFSLQILLPAESDRKLQRWCEGMPGTSWPSWGGHITLLPAFTCPDTVDLHALINAVVQRIAPSPCGWITPLPSRT